MVNEIISKECEEALENDMMGYISSGTSEKYLYMSRIEKQYDNCCSSINNTDGEPVEPYRGYRDTTIPEASKWFESVTPLFSAARWFGAYGLKHRIEKASGHYCSKETAQAAAEISNLKLRAEGDHLNAWIRLRSY